MFSSDITYVLLSATNKHDLVNNCNCFWLIFEKIIFLYQKVYLLHVFHYNGYTIVHSNSHYLIF